MTTPCLNWQRSSRTLKISAGVRWQGEREKRATLKSLHGIAKALLPKLGISQAEQIVRRDVMPGFVAAELIVWLSEHKIIRPGHTTLQELVSEALSTERRRLGGLLAEVLDESGQSCAGPAPGA